jgi:hypothetical protein
MKNKFTTENAAMILIDHQVGTIKLAKNIPQAEIIMNMRCLLARGGNRNAARSNQRSGNRVSGTAARRFKENRAGSL